MPGRDGTGPYGTGLRGGRGYGQGNGFGMGAGRGPGCQRIEKTALEVQVKNLMLEIEQIKEQLKTHDNI